MNVAYNVDCMEYMKTVPDKYFDLAVVDPPYGIEKGFKENSRIRKYGQMETVNDRKPTAEYFEQLFRVSKNQIIFGYNHLSDMFPPTKEFIFWYNHNPVASYSDGELAWTSFKKQQNVLIIRFLVLLELTLMVVFIRHKNLLPCIHGFSGTTQSREIKS